MLTLLVSYSDSYSLISIISFCRFTEIDEEDFVHEMSMSFFMSYDEGFPSAPSAPSIGAVVPGTPSVGSPSGPAIGVPSTPAFPTIGGTPGAPSVGNPGDPSVGTPGAPSVGNPGAPSAGTSNAPSIGTPSTSLPSSSSKPSLPPGGTFSPSFTQTSSPNAGVPTQAPTTSGRPTTSAVPTETNTPTSEFDGSESLPTLSPTPTAGGTGSGITPSSVFDLDDDAESVIVVEPLFIGRTTTVRLEIRYVVEAFFNDTEEFKADIDKKIFVTAVMASLGASDSGVLETLSSRRLGYSSIENSYSPFENRYLLSSSSFDRKSEVYCMVIQIYGFLLLLCLIDSPNDTSIGPCNTATVAGANCWVMKADVLYILNGNRNVAFSSYLAYLALYEEMGDYDADLPGVARVAYLAPQPVLPPAALGEDPNSTATGDNFISSGTSDTGVRPLIAGVVSGGLLIFVLIVGYVANGRRRVLRGDAPFQHQELEDEYLPETSPDSSPRESAQIVRNSV